MSEGRNCNQSLGEGGGVEYYGNYVIIMMSERLVGWIRNNS